MRFAIKTCSPDIKEFGNVIFQALSTIAHSIFLIVTGLSSIFNVQAASQGAGHILPVNSGKLLVE